jgi:hypothetical protein
MNRNRKETGGHEPTGAALFSDEAFLSRRSLSKKLDFLAGVGATVRAVATTGPDVELATCDRLLWLVEARPGRD